MAKITTDICSQYLDTLLYKFMNFPFACAKVQNKMRNEQ